MTDYERRVRESLKALTGDDSRDGKARAARAQKALDNIDVVLIGECARAGMAADDCVVRLIEQH
jgi:hypothetical protein